MEATGVDVWCRQCRCHPCQCSAWVAGHRDRTPPASVPSPPEPGACPCGLEDAARYPLESRRVSVPTSANCPIHYCGGSSTCTAHRHVHGCFADKGNCDHPTEHNNPSGPPEQSSPGQVG